MGLFKKWQFLNQKCISLGYESKEEREKDDSSSTCNDGLVWNKIWRLKAPAVVKNFLWKAINNCLPTKENLATRIIVEDPSCPICNREVESVCYSLWSRGTSTGVAEVSGPVQKWNSNEREFFSIWKILVQKLKHEELEKVAIIMRN